MASEGLGEPESLAFHVCLEVSASHVELWERDLLGLGGE